MSCTPACNEMHTFASGCESAMIGDGCGTDPRVGLSTVNSRFTEALRDVLKYRGLDPDSEALEGTPDRWLRAFQEFTSGYSQDPADILGRTFDVDHSGYPISVTNVPFTSVCEHHLLPFSGYAMISYMPGGGRVAGLSKLPRLLDVYARRLQTQEQITKQVTDALEKHLQPQGAACILGSEHGCLANRGARKPGAVMVTGSFTGIYDDPETRRDLLAMLGGPSAYR